MKSAALIINTRKTRALSRRCSLAFSLLMLGISMQTRALAQYHGNLYTNYPTYATIPVENWPRASQYSDLTEELNRRHQALLERCEVSNRSTSDIGPLADGLRRPGIDIRRFQQKFESVVNWGRWVATNEMNAAGNYNDWFGQDAVTQCWHEIDLIQHSASTNWRNVSMKIYPGESWTNTCETNAYIVRIGYPQDTVATVAVDQVWQNTYSYDYDTTNIVPAVTNVYTNTTLLAEGATSGDSSQVWQCWKWTNSWVVLETGTNWYTDDIYTNITPCTTNYSDSQIDYKTFKAKISAYQAAYTQTNYIFLGYNAVTGDVRRPLTNSPSQFPIETKGGLFYRVGIGSVSNVQMDHFGFVTNAAAQWTEAQYPGGTQYGYAPYRLTEEALQECRKAVDTLRFTKASQTWTTPFRRYAGAKFLIEASGTIVSPSDWDILEAQAATNFHRFQAYAPEACTWKNVRIDGRGAFLIAVREVANGLITGLSTNYAHLAQFYAVSEIPYGAHEDDDYRSYDSGLLWHKYISWDTTIVSKCDNMLSHKHLGPTNLPSPWCSDPPFGGHECWGYRVTHQMSLIKWDVTGGFEYK